MAIDKAAVEVVGKQSLQIATIHQTYVLPGYEPGGPFTHR
jgi:hypothetical protein